MAIHKLATRHYNIAYQQHGNPRGEKILAIHGWMDNQASFTPLLPYLQQYNVVTIDLPGHGQSSHRSNDALLLQASYVMDIIHIVNALKWDSFHILGHSMGGAIGMIASIPLQKKVQTVAMIDCIGPVNIRAKNSAKQLIKACRQYTKPTELRSRCYSDWPSAISRRVRNTAFPIQREHAELLVKGCMQENSDGSISHLGDRRLHFASPMSLCEKQTNTYIKAVEQPAFIVVASEGLLVQLKSTKKRLKKYRYATTVYIEGGHYVHMEQAKVCADAYLAFLSDAQTSEN